MEESFFPHFLKSGTVLSFINQQVMIGYGPRTWAHCIEELDANSPIFYFPDFFLEIDKPWFQHTHWKVLKLDEFKQSLPLPTSSSLVHWQHWDEALFQRVFAQLQTEFDQGILKKAVAYLFAYASDVMTPSRLQKALNKATTNLKNYSEYIYGFWDEYEGILGVTPEILFSYENQKLKTMAVAGTSSKTANKEAFRTNIKQLEEHAFVVEDMQKSLQPFGHVQTGLLQVLELPALYHLMTPIQLSLKSSPHFESLIKALHPTPALGAVPRLQGWNWLKSYRQQLDRGRYGAPVGVLDLKNNLGHCLVAIRNVQWDKSGMRIGAGCGIVKKSHYQSEWQEMYLKLNSIKHALDL